MVPPRSRRSPPPEGAPVRSGRPGADSSRASLVRSLPPVYAAAALRLAFPLLLLPLMAARLGAEEFGRLSLFLLWAGLLSTLVEGGFLAAATRLAVRADGAGRWALARQIYSARIALSGAALLLSAAVAVWLLRPAPVPELLFAALLLGLAACALGWQATWYLQASEQLHRWAWVEIVVYALWAAAVLWLGHSTTAYLLLQVFATAALAAIGWGWLRSDLAAPGQRLWARAEVRPGLRLGWAMLPVSVAGAAYSFALPAVAAAQMSRTDLGVYFLADRIVRSMLAAADPLFQLVYPRIVARFGGGLRLAWNYSARWALLGAVLGLALLLLGALAWPSARTALEATRGGLDAARLQPVLAVLGLLLPLLLCWKFFGYWMLGSGRFDGAYRACVVIGGVAGVVAAWLSGSRGAVALAEVAVAIEVLVICSAIAGMGWTLRAQRAPRA